MKLNLFLVIIFSFSFIVLPKISSSQILLDYEEIGIKFYPQKSVDTIELMTTKFNKKYKCRIYLKSLHGACDFEIFDNKGRIFLEGHYSNSLDTLYNYKFSKRKGDGQNNKTTYGVTLNRYFFPLKIDEWIYYNKKGKIIEKYVYEYEIL